MGVKRRTRPSTAHHLDEAVNIEFLGNFERPPD
jgi:hypothetical protein